VLEEQSDIVAVKELDVTRNSSGDEIANMNFLYDDIVHVLYDSTIVLLHNKALLTSYCANTEHRKPNIKTLWKVKLRQ